MLDKLENALFLNNSFFLVKYNLNVYSFVNENI